MTGTRAARARASLSSPARSTTSNGLILATQLASAGRRRGAAAAGAATIRAATRAALEQGLEADVLVTTGGVSVGEHDLVREGERELGVEEVFWRVALRPGKPLAFGVRGATLVFGLPGNPVSSLVGVRALRSPGAARRSRVSPSRGRRFGPGRLARSTAAAIADRDSLLRARRGSRTVRSCSTRSAVRSRT